MLIIDLTTRRVQSNQRFDPDVVILKGATPELINSLTKLAALPAASDTPATKPKNYPLRPVSSKVTKIPIANRDVVSKTVPASVKAYGNDFDATFAQISSILNGRVPEPAKTQKPKPAKTQKVTTASQNPVADRRMLQVNVASWIRNAPGVVETIRLALQNSSQLNPMDATITTRNAEAIIALYASYGTDEGFSSSEGVAKIASQIQISSDTLLRLYNETALLNKYGGGKQGPRYFVEKATETTILNVVRKYPAVAKIAEVIQAGVSTLAT